jgi:hypothetical protein
MGHSPTVMAGRSLCASGENGGQRKAWNLLRIGAGWDGRESGGCLQGGPGIGFSSQRPGWCRERGFMASRMGPRRVCLRIFNTKNTKNPRSPTEKSNSALRAKRLKLPEHASGTAKPLLPETFVILRGSFVVSVLRFSNRNGAGDNHCAPSAVPRLLAPQYPYSYNKKTRRLNTPSSPDRHEACLPL